MKKKKKCGKFYGKPGAVSEEEQRDLDITNELVPVGLWSSWKWYKELKSLQRKTKTNKKSKKPQQNKPTKQKPTPQTSK